MDDAAAQQIWALAQALQRQGHAGGKFSQVVGTAVCQFALGQVPDAFVWVELGRIAGEIVHDKTAVALAQRIERLAVVNAGIVEQHEERAAKVVQQLADELAHTRAVEVLIGIDSVVERQMVAMRTDADRRDHRHLVAARAVSMARGVATRRPGLEHGGNQEEARFVEEDEMGTQPGSVFFTRDQLTSFQRTIAASLRSCARRSGF